MEDIKPYSVRATEEEHTKPICVRRFLLLENECVLLKRAGLSSLSNQILKIRKIFILLMLVFLNAELQART